MFIKCIFVPVDFEIPGEKQSNYDDSINKFLDINHISRFYVRNHPILEDTYLTQKEALCALQFLKGMTAKKTGDALYRSKRTVETHINNIKRKLRCDNKLQLINLLVNHVFTDSFLQEQYG